MNDLEPCPRCAELIDPAAWCKSCVDAGRADLDIIHAGVVDAWMRNQDKPAEIAQKVYGKLRLFGRL